eukprot:CAMPEP_0197586782 /NCGR_PEP_ID=MMETSP1326-20131121/8641_1 /TAXON_ID=1155430 /ORGANISM="Genus nov. species nov., Strain RCC2288" /LENGTH=63 /DNA_ID=CAMNT_0043151443 /DNA_START=101 /DNA_END=292 /DNA_ORIENTATION=-
MTITRAEEARTPQNWHEKHLRQASRGWDGNGEGFGWLGGWVGWVEANHVSTAEWLPRRTSAGE